MNELTTIDGYCNISKTSLEFKRDVNREEWQQVFDACNHIEGCIQFWIGDLLKYREQKWGMYDDVAENTGIDKTTLRKYKEVSEQVESGRRQPDLTFSHHQSVAYLEPEQQNSLLKKANDEHLTVRELREEVKKEKFKDKKVIPLPDNKYQVIYADPPWAYNDKCEAGGIQSKPLSEHYPSMSIDELCKMDIYDLCLENTVLFLWVTSPLLEDGFKVINSWGFKYKTSFVWDKIKHNMGHYNSVRHEFLLICTRGACTPDNIKLFDSVQSIEKTKKHSEKPEEFRNIIDTLYKGKKIELFARKKVDGWDSWGNEL